MERVPNALGSGFSFPAAELLDTRCSHRDNPGVMVPDVLREELAFFEENRSAWVTIHPGKFALIKGRNLLDTFTTFPEAYGKGVELFGPEPFLVKLIVPQEPKHTIPALSLHLLHASLQ